MILARHAIALVTLLALPCHAQDSPETPPAAPSRAHAVHLPDPEVPMPASRILVLQRQYESGRSILQAGEALCAGGLALIAGSLLGQAPEALGPGILLFEIGVPLLGAGSGNMAKARSLLDDTLALGISGWVPYGIGTSLLGLSAGALTMAAFLSSESDHDPAPLVSDAKLYAAAGLALQGLAIAKFERTARRAMDSNRNGPWDIAFLPTAPGAHGAPLPGATFSLTF